MALSASKRTAPHPRMRGCIRCPSLPPFHTRTLPSPPPSHTRTLLQAYVHTAGQADAIMLDTIVRTEGINRNKAYFYAYMEGKELVVINKMLPTQPW
jgi:hypothetical protein